MEDPESIDIDKLADDLEDEKPKPKKQYNFQKINYYKLSDAEKKKIDEYWEKLSKRGGEVKLKKLIQLVFGTEKDLDGRTKEGIALKAYLAEKGAKAQGAGKEGKAREPVLDDVQKNFIENHALDMKPLEITRLLFKNDKLTPLSVEFRVVNRYYGSLEATNRLDVKDECLKRYYPPLNDSHAIARINKYVFQGIDSTRITPRDRECVRTLIKFCQTFRFLQQINSLTKASERDLFESSFIRYTWNKPDLTEEDIDLYLNLCMDLIQHKRMEEELNTLKEMQEMQIGSEDQKLHMSIVEAIGKLRSDLDASGKKQEKTLQSLNGRRDKRLDKVREDNSSILTIVQHFRDAEKRKSIIKAAEAHEEALKNETDRLEEQDDLIAEIFGASKDELIH